MSVVCAVGYLLLTAVPVGAQSEVDSVDDRAGVLGPLVGLFLITVWVVAFGLSIRRARTRRGPGTGQGP